MYTVPRISQNEGFMKIKVVIHEAEEGGYWAEVPAIPGCATQGETFEELLQNLYEAVEGCLAVDVSPAKTSDHDRIVEIAV
jgi:predicted RNase H-like HicB family nuclease